MTLRSIAKRLLPVAVRRWLRERTPGFLDGVRSLGRKTCTRRYLGFTLVYNRGNSLVHRLRQEPVFERELGEAMVADLTRTPGLFLDVGSNLGLMSLFVLSKLPHQKIFAFEPGPTQRRLLTETVSRNNLDDRVEIIGRAIGASSGRQTFFVHRSADVAKDGLVDTGRSDIAERIEVEVETLDRWWAAAGKPEVSVIKVDTEGAEKLVFDGAREMITATRPAIYFEMEESNLRSYPYDAPDVLGSIARIGYGFSTLDGEPVTVETLAKAMGTADTFRAFSKT